MVEPIPQRESLSSNGQRKKLSRSAVREHPRTAVKIADQAQVRAVLKLMSCKGLPFGQACGRVGVSQPAFWRRALNDPELKRELAALCISKPWDRADQASAGGNASALSVFAKIGEKMAASLSPQDWGEKVQVDRRQLVIVTNLDFSGVCENLNGILIEGGGDAGEL